MKFFNSEIGSGKEMNSIIDKTVSNDVQALVGSKLHNTIDGAVYQSVGQMFNIALSDIIFRNLRS